MKKFTVALGAALAVSAMVAASLSAASAVTPAAAPDTGNLRLLKDIGPGTFPFGLSGSGIALGDRLLFVADDGVIGSELWITDGTTAGTKILKDIAPGAPESDPYRFAVFKGKAYFTAYTEENGHELWMSDGTTAGTTLLKDVITGPASTNPGDITVVGDKFFFGINDIYNEPANSKAGVWVSDGTTAGTVKLDVPGLDSEHLRGSAFTAMGNRVVFQGRDVAHGAEPWVSDGTVAGTRLLADTVPGPEPLNNLGRLVSLGDQVLFFVRDQVDPDNTYYLWRTDGTPAGTRKIGDVRPEAGANDPGPVRYHDRLLFAAKRPGEGFELWISNGTDAGTRIVKDIRPGPGSSFPNQFTVFNDTVYFAVDTADAQELWATKGTAASTRQVKKVLVRDPNDPGYLGAPPGSGQRENPDGFTVVAGRLYFSAATTQGGGARTWSTDGTTAGTVPLPTLPGLFLSAPLGVIDGRSVHVGSDQTYGLELWVRDAPTGARALSTPKISGKKLVGSRLSSSLGTWSRPATYTRQWLRNGSPIAGASGATYTLRAADVRAVISVRVTARTGEGIQSSSTSSSLAGIKFSSSTKVATSKRGRTVVLTVRVKSSSSAKPTGKVRVMDGERILKRVSLNNGKARIVLRNQTARKHRYSLVYLGSTSVAGSRDAATARIR